jgi:hypothetical protein
MRVHNHKTGTPRQRRFFVLFVCFVDNQIHLQFIRENPCSSVAKKTSLIRGSPQQLPGGPRPLTPDPSPPAGARGGLSFQLGGEVRRRG